MNGILIPNTIKGRKRLSATLNLTAPGYSKCHCCNIVWKYVQSKVLMYNNTSGYFPICSLCFTDPKIPYEKLIEYYTHSEYTTYTSIEKEYIKNSLFEETKTDSIIKEKYLIYLKNKRINKIDDILKQE